MDERNDLAPTGTNAAAGAELVLKPDIWRAPITYIYIAVGIALTAIIAVEAKSSQKLWAVGMPVVWVVLWFAQQRVVGEMVVTADRVTDRGGPGGKRTAKRSAIASIHRQSYWTLLRDSDGRVVMKTGGWTKSQLEQLASTLRVPFVDHRHGVRGRLFG